MIPGYAGTIAWVDLTEGRVWTEALETSVAEGFLGGKGLGAYLLWRHVKGGEDPYGPGNLLVFLAGPLTGTGFPATSRSAIVTKSPLTGTFLDSYAGGYFGPHLKYLGYDALVVRGVASAPALVRVGRDGVGIESAQALWGLSTIEAEARLTDPNRTAGDRVSVACIGPAGENLVRFANVINNRRAYGRGGTGAVMGAKRLKAVVLQGAGRIGVADEAGLREATRRARERIRTNPMTRRGGSFPRVGTMPTAELTQETGTLPTRNWQENSFEENSSLGTGPFSVHIVRARACYGCPIGCSRDSVASFGGTEFLTEGPEYETIYAFGPNCGISDPRAIIALDALCDEYGIDTISCGVAVSFAMECFERGLLGAEAGPSLAFGDADGVIAAVHRIAKREGLGDLLSQGVKLASERIEGSSSFAMHVKGMELPGYDPRGMKGQSLTYALSDRGGCHLRSNMLRTELLGQLDRYTYEGKARAARDLQLNYALYDCLISCVFSAFAITGDDYAAALSSVTGRAQTLDELKRTAERVWNLTRMFNVREGFTRRDDALPPRLHEEASTRGPSGGHVVERAAFEAMLDEYYDLAGWDGATGVPRPEKLRELGLEGLIRSGC